MSEQPTPRPTDPEPTDTHSVDSVPAAAPAADEPQATPTETEPRPSSAEDRAAPAADSVPAPAAPEASGEPAADGELAAEVRPVEAPAVADAETPAVGQPAEAPAAQTSPAETQSVETQVAETPAGDKSGETAADQAAETAAVDEGAEAPVAETSAAETPIEAAAPEAPVVEKSAEAPTPEAPVVEKPAQAPAEQPAAAPTPSAVPKPRAIPKPSAIPKPTAMPRRPATPTGAPPAVVVPPAADDAREAAAAAAWGRVDPDGTVWVREAAGERTVGQYAGADSVEALAFYVRRFLELHAQVVLFESRLPQLTIKEIDQTLDSLTDSLREPAAVGDLDGLRAKVEQLRGRGQERRAELAAEREAARAEALAERTTIVEQAEAIAAADPAKVHWRSSGDELRRLLDQWKSAQRSGPRLTRSSEDGLWKRFSRARTIFDRNRGHFFAALDATQAEAKRAKEKLVQRAEEMSSSTDWGATSAAYRALMDEWKQSGRASRKEDDALWTKFRAAQQVFFDARNEQNAKTDAEFAANLEVKLALLEQAEALLPVTDPQAAKSALRPIQDKWEEAGKVPRADIQRIEARMRAVEQAVRDADQQRWHRTDPEKKARAEGAAAQLYEAIEGLENDRQKAVEQGDADAIKAATAALEARQSWLTQVLRTAND